MIEEKSRYSIHHHSWCGLWTRRNFILTFMWEEKLDGARGVLSLCCFTLASHRVASRHYRLESTAA
jgi:hypothetical protein